MKESLNLVLVFVVLFSASESPYASELELRECEIFSAVEKTIIVVSGQSDPVLQQALESFLDLYREESDQFEGISVHTSCEILTALALPNMDDQTTFFRLVNYLTYPAEFDPSRQDRWVVGFFPAIKLDDYPHLDGPSVTFSEIGFENVTKVTTCARDMGRCARTELRTDRQEQHHTPMPKRELRSYLRLIGFSANTGARQLN